MLNLKPVIVSCLIIDVINIVLISDNICNINTLNINEFCYFVPQPTNKHFDANLLRFILVNIKFSGLIVIMYCGRPVVH